MTKFFIIYAKFGVVKCLLVPFSSFYFPIVSHLSFHTEYMSLHILEFRSCRKSLCINSGLYIGVKKSLYLIWVFSWGDWGATTIEYKAYLGTDELW